jgi:hypothetical protein
MKHDNLTVTIKNWDTYNPRNDVKNPSWFRMSNGFFEDPDFYDFTAIEIQTWIYIMSLASKKSSATITINFTHAERIGRIKRRELLEAAKKLQAIHVITVDVTDAERERNGDVTETHATLHNKTDITDITNTSTLTRASVLASLDLLYRRYPKKRGKAAGIKRLAGMVKTQDDLDSVTRALDTYLRYLKREATEPRYILHFSSWVSEWRDWLDNDAGKIVLVSSPQIPLVAPPREKEPEHEPPPADLLKSHGGLFKKFGIGGGK